MEACMETGIVTKEIDEIQQGKAKSHNFSPFDVVKVVQR